MTNFLLMVPGLMTRNTGTYGCLMWKMALGHMQPVGIGLLPIMVIPGYPIIPGDGQLSTTDAGVMMIIMAGNGFRAMNGHLPG